MKRLIVSLLMLTILCAVGTTVFAADDQDKAKDDGFISLFDGKSLEGWKVGENADSFKVEDGMIVANGPCAHLFYDGKVNDHNFKNFHFKADVKTMPNSNAGLYIHTKYQESSWPSIGYEIQVNLTHGDPKKTGGLYGIRDISADEINKITKDGEWYTQEIIVQGKRIISIVNGKKLVDYVEPDDVEGGRKLSTGTFAIQAHDPGSKVYLKNIKVKPLD